MNNKKVKIEKIDNILDDSLSLYWSGNQYYSADILSDKDKEQIRDITCVRYYFEGARGERDDYDKVFNECYQYLNKLIFIECELNKYQINIENTAQIPNKIRSFKGIFDKKNIDRNFFIEVEEAYKDKTIIGGIIKLTEENFYSNINILGNSRMGFILCSSNNYFSREKLREIIREYRKEDTHTSINYLKIILKLCTEGDIIYKISGDGGDKYLAIDVFKKS